MRLIALKNQKQAYLDAVGFHRLPHAKLLQLHAINQVILDKWLYVPDRYPSFKACWEMYMYLDRMELHIPLTLQRLISEPVNHIEHVAHADLNVAEVHPESR
ncbi:hypothetical protein CWS43_26820 [Rahnella sp. AA]|uniref:hypothetical protein n=1 Tax=Rahnella sp. AA TaxID=2057180 RepID=UPI000C33AB31|nr:hypothetical protein [Rahnella sp. AA]PKE27460.1 hypothetical protein CWS43_26820 [Rahnella sp. AA]